MSAIRVIPMLVHAYLLSANLPMKGIHESSSGFTLIEVLVAMTILAIGLLGVASLQANSLRNNQNAYYRSVATQFAYNIADRIRVNQVESQKGITSKYLSSPAKAKAKSSCTTNGCTPAEFAENDLFIWYSALTTELPLGRGTITYKAGVYTVTISWDENKDGEISVTDPNFQVSFI